MLELSRSETTSWVGQLEWPQEVVGLLEVWTNSVDLVDQVLDRQDVVLTESSLNDRVVVQSNSLLVDLTETSLVDQLSDGGQRWVTVSNVRLGQLDQLRGSLGQLNEDTGVNLGQSQQLQDLSWLRWDLHDTLDSNDEDQLWLGVDVVRTSSLSLTLSVDDGTLSLVVLLGVSSGSVEDNLSLLLVRLDMLVSLLHTMQLLFSPERWLIDRQHRRS